jgi:transcriptional antiterminator NusG
MMTEDMPTAAVEPNPLPPDPAGPAAEHPAPQAALPAPEAPAEATEEPKALEAPAEEGAEPVAAESPATEAAAEPPVQQSNKRWYVVKVQSGREESIKEAIERKVKIEGLEEYFGQIYIPTEKVTEVRKSKRYTRERKKLPGYIMAEVEFNDRILYLFRETSGVGDFVGGSLNRPPTPMTEREVQRWFGKGTEEGQPKVII